LCVFVAGLEGVSQALISGVEVDSFEERMKQNGGVEVVNDEKKSNGVVTVGREGVDQRPVID
jgi:hypothetical protein